MAAALPGHLTFFSDLRELPDEVVAQARPDRLLQGRTRPAHADDDPARARPAEKRWTALQSWDPDRGRGALLAFRQDDPRPAAAIALDEVPPRRCFALRQVPDGAPAGHATSAELTRGLRIELPSPNTARVLVIEPSARSTCKDRRPAG